MLTLLAAVFAVHFPDRQVLAILITPIKAALGLSDTALGFLAGFAFTVVFSTVGVVIARIADVANRVGHLGHAAAPGISAGYNAPSPATVAASSSPIRRE
jgi:hypothetical protein